MNLLLLEAGEIDASGIATVTDVRRLSALQHLGIEAGRRLRIGVLDGQLGTGTVLDQDRQQLRLRCELHDEPPPPSRIELLLALPRPKMLRRMLCGASEAGVKKIWLLNSYRVQKSYWQSPLLEQRRLREYLLQGLEQAGDTRLPRVFLQPRFRPFVEDELPGLCRERLALLAQPGAVAPCPRGVEQPVTLAIGPEGGFTDFEQGLLQQTGFRAVSLGARVLRVETALGLLLGRIQ